MLKPNIELVRDGKRQGLLTWHKHDAEGNTIPIAMEFSDDLDAEDRQRVIDVCERPLTVRENGQNRTVFSGSSAHFLGMPRLLERLGFRVRNF
jgi:hypothetical protein